MSEPDLDAYALKTAVAVEIAAPDLAYRPPLPSSYRPRIALVGAGGISAAHLDAYREMGLDVAVIANRTLSKAEARRDEYFPRPKRPAISRVRWPVTTSPWSTSLRILPSAMR